MPIRIRSKKKKGNPYILGTLFVVVGLGVWVFAPGFFAKEFRLRDQGIPIMATVVEDPDHAGQAFTKCRHRSRSADICEYVVSYEYEGVDYQEKLEEAYTHKFSLEPGDCIAAAIDPEDYYVIVEAEAARGAWGSILFFIFMGVLFPALGVFILIKAIRDRVENLET